MTEGRSTLLKVRWGGYSAGPGRVDRWSRGVTKNDDPGGFGAYENPFSTNTFGPIGICTDREGRVWVSSLNGRVQLYTSEGEYLTGIGSVGSSPGQFVTPHGMVVDNEGYLYVVDSGNHRVQKFELVRAGSVGG